MCKMVLDPNAASQKHQFTNLDIADVRVPVVEAVHHIDRLLCYDHWNWHLYCHKIGSVLYVTRAAKFEAVVALSGMDSICLRRNKVAAVWAYLP